MYSTKYNFDNLLMVISKLANICCKVKRRNNYIILYLNSFFTLTTLLFSQGKWGVQNPLPTEAYLLAIEPVTDNRIFAGGLGGTLLKTTNAGKSWKVQRLKDLLSIRSIGFQDSLNGWLIDSEHIFNTIDGGESWREVYIESDMLIYSFLEIICFDNTIYLFLKPKSAAIWELPNAKSLVLKSTDRGKTWKQLEQEIKGKILCGFFLNENIGFMNTDETISISESYAYFYKTSDGGKTWSKNSFPEYPGPTPGIFFLNEKFGFIGKYRTTDGGITWENMFQNLFSQSEYIDDIFFPDSLHGWSISGAKILITTDAGLSWIDINQNSSHQLTDINFSQNGTGWIVGWAGNIFRKNTESDFWESLTTGNRNNLNDVFFTDENKGWCVGCDGTILHTSNGGETWEEQNSSIDSDLFKVKFLNSLEGWILGHYIVLYTTDGGKNWEIRNDLNGWFVDIDFFDDQNGLLVEHFGAVLKTKDAGMNWQLVNNEPLSVRLTSVAILNENEAWIGGWQGLAHTADKGATIQWYDVPNISLVRDLQFVENNSGFLSNDYGDFLVTKDGGWNWHELPRGQGLNAMVSTFWALNANKVWIYLGLASGHLKQITADQTLTITEIPEYWVHTINSIFFINPNIGWAIGEGGTILKYTDDSSSSIKVQGKQIYIFPNPFDETGTNISFLLQQSQQVTIQIYNSLGQKLITLYEGLLNNGVIKIFWKPNNLASGVYFISIRSNEFNHAQKCAYVHH